MTGISIVEGDFIQTGSINFEEWFDDLPEDISEDKLEVEKAPSEDVPDALNQFARTI